MEFMPLVVRAYTEYDNKDFQTKSLYYRTKDISILIDALRSPDKLNPPIRDLIADVLEEKFKPKRGRKTNLDRDFSIAIEVHIQRQFIKHLRSNKNKEGCAAKVAEKYGLDEEAVIKIYRQIDKTVDLEKSSPGRVFMKDTAYKMTPEELLQISAEIEKNIKDGKIPWIKN